MLSRKSKPPVFTSVLWMHTGWDEDLFTMSDEDLYVFELIVRESLC